MTCPVRACGRITGNVAHTVEVDEQQLAFGYCRVSTEEQALSGLGLAAQRTRLEDEAARRRWGLEVFVDEGYSAKDMNRPALSRLLDEIAPGDILAVAKLDRLSRSLIDFVNLMDVARRQGWQVVALDLGVDTTTPAGQMLANVMASFAEYERQVIGERTRVALAARKSAGFKLGGPRLISDDIVQQIVRCRSAGHSLRTIAEDLNSRGVPTARDGKQWYPSTIATVLRYATPETTD